MTQNNKFTPDPNLEQRQARISLEHKKRAITAGVVVALDPDEADQLGISGMDSLDPADPMSKQIEQDMMDSRFDACEIDLDSFQIITKK